jgi:hypothetical protein
VKDNADTISGYQRASKRRNSRGSMRSVATIAALIVVMATGAKGQSSWQEYTYPDQQFAASFPSQPTVATMPFKAANGTARD